MGGEYGLLVREPVGVVGAIIPWNAPLSLITYKIAPALIAGCTVVLKSSPEAPGDAYLFAEIAEDIGLPPGVLNVVTADREVSELLVRNPGIDKITFTGSTAAGRRIASLCGERIARCTLELGGKSAAVILDDMDLQDGRQRHLGGGVLPLRAGLLLADPHHRQPLAPRRARRGSGRHLLAGQGGRPLRSADPDGAARHGPPARPRRGLHRQGHRRGGNAGHRRRAGPKDLDRGYYIEPTVFGNVDNQATIAREEIFGPVLSVIPADNEDHAVTLANDTIYGLNASVFTNDVDRARQVAGQLRSGTVGPQRLPHRLRDGVRRLQAVGHRTGRAGPRASCRSSRPRR